MNMLKVTIFLLDESSEIEYRISDIPNALEAAKKLKMIMLRVAPNLTTSEQNKLAELTSRLALGAKTLKGTLSRAVSVKIALRKED